MNIFDEIKDAMFRRRLRTAATKVVDYLHDANTEVILLAGTSSQPSFSLVAEAWRRRYPNKPLPQPLPVTSAKEKDVKGKRVALFDELTVSGGSLRDAYRRITPLGALDCRMVALLEKSQLSINSTNPLVGAIDHSRNLGTKLSLNARRYIREAELDRKKAVDKAEKTRFRESAKYWAREVREKRAELREIASSIKPRKLKG
ncbi:MAG: phosphoribosyltransferase [Candidatus Micrarchaeota archaeon]|nr:phosphoribosyltransferase [Candidatus Micrarchaeota archaeon]